MSDWNFFEGYRHAEPNPGQQLAGVICNVNALPGYSYVNSLALSRRLIATIFR